MSDREDAPKPVHRRAGDADVLALAEGLAASLSAQVNRADLDVLRTVAESYPDVGRDGAGDVVASLKGLIADFLATGEYDRSAILVHVRAWRFMVSRKPGKTERLRVLSGLQNVRDRYAPPHAA
ncbi:MAG: hypothetical protein U1C74_12995 [Phenylobacterium sp.]|nr:hypothetical protein [Phenylobacterium sp.]